MPFRNDVLDADPWLAESVFNAYAKAKEQALELLRTMGWAMISLPWTAQEGEATRELMGDAFWPYGIEPNTATLEPLLAYAHEQGLAQRAPALDELFHPSTHSMNG